MDADVRSLVRLRKRKRMFRVLRYVLLVSVLLGAVYVLFFSPVFSVKSVSVIGNYYATEKKILKAADISPGVQIARLDATAIETAILKLPEVKSVEVRRGWPNQVILAVKERTPMAVTKDGGVWRYVSQKGIVFGISTSKPTQFLSVSGINAETFAEAAKVSAALPSWLRDRVENVKGLSRDNVIVWLTNGVEIRWGSSEASEFKGRVLQQLMGLKAEMYNVSVPDQPTIRK